MNVRKNIDYSQMYRVIDEVMTQKLPQMQMYTAIGKIVCSRSEKGTAVMASEYIRATYPDVQGFSPRNLRRMRDFWHTYEGHPALLSLVMELGWTQNVVIMEAELTMELRDWYLRAVRQFGWSKTELIKQIAAEAHLEIVLDFEHEEGECAEKRKEENVPVIQMKSVHFIRKHLRYTVLHRCRGSPKAWMNIYY